MNKRTTGIVLGGVAMAIAFGLLWNKGGEPSPEAAYLNRAVVAQGADLYANNCASCHGAALQGQANWKSRDNEGYLPAPPHNETGHTWHHPTEQLFEITKFGSEQLVGGTYKSRMAGYADVLSDDEIAAVLAYIKSTWSARVIAQHNQINAGS
ncbi:MAG: mono/diheme cytochrome c family protein [Paracoccaceae bacterium]|jgi:mono/diheme cytochrome c family protein